MFKTKVNNQLGRVSSGKNDPIDKKSKNSNQKEKIFRPTIHKKLQKKAKTLQKSHKLSLFKILSVAFRRPRKSDKKATKSVNLSVFTLLPPIPAQGLSNRIIWEKK